MINTFDLYDIHTVFVNIRAYPKYNINDKILLNLLKLFNNIHQYEGYNLVRRSLRTLNITDYDEFNFIYVDNYYTYIPDIVTNIKIYEIFCCIFESMLQAVKLQQYDQLEDLADAMHNFPIILFPKNIKKLKLFWKNNIATYQKKWDKNFLIKHKRFFRNIKYNILN